MKTTIEINDVLLRQAQEVALERNVSFKAVVETALRQFLNQAEAPTQPGPKPRKCTFKGEGLQPRLDEEDFATIRAMAYEGQGG